MIKWYLYPQEKPIKNGNYIIAIEFDDELVIETDYWFEGVWDDSYKVIAWAELPTLDEFKMLIGADDEQ